MPSDRNCRLFETMSRNARIELYLRGVRWTRTFSNMHEAARNAESLRLIEPGMGHVVAGLACGFPNIYQCRVADEYDARQLRAAGFSSMSLLGGASSVAAEYSPSAATIA